MYIAEVTFNIRHMKEYLFSHLMVDYFFVEWTHSNAIRRIIGIMKKFRSITSISMSRSEESRKKMRS